MTTTPKSQISLNRSKTVQSQTISPQAVLKRSKTGNIKVLEDYIVPESKATTASSTPMPTSSSTEGCEEDNKRRAYSTVFEEERRSLVLEGQTKRSVRDKTTWSDPQQESIYSQYNELLREMKDCSYQQDREMLKLKKAIQALQGEVRTLVRSAGQKLTVCSCKYTRINAPLEATQVPNPPIITHSQSLETVRKIPIKLTQNQLESSKSAKSSLSTSTYCEAMKTLSEARQSIARTLAVSSALRLRAEAN